MVDGFVVSFGLYVCVVEYCWDLIVVVVVVFVLGYNE